MELSSSFSPKINILLGSTDLAWIISSLAITFFRRLLLILVADRGQILGLEGYLSLGTGRGLLFARFAATGGNHQRVEDLFLRGHVVAGQAEVLQ